MIFRGMSTFFDGIFEFFIMFTLMIGIMTSIGISHSIQMIGSLYFLILLLVFTEIAYHLEPRTKEDIKNGRSYWRVFYKKIDSAADGCILISIGTLIYQAVILITIDGIMKTLQVVGIITASIISIILYLWINRLRDIPKKKTKTRKKSK